MTKKEVGEATPVDVLETREALQFLGRRGALQVYEVEWTCRAQWHVAAESREAVSRVVEKMGHDDVAHLIRANDLEVWVSEDQVGRARKFQEQFGRQIEVGEPDVGVCGRKLCDLKKYVSKRVWELLEQWRPHLECQQCGQEAPMVRWRVKRRHTLALECPACKIGVDWRRVLREVMPGRSTVPAFAVEEGVADGAAASREG